MPSFAVSIACLSLLQAVLVALPRYRAKLPWMPASRWWALVPAGSIAVVVGIVEFVPDSATVLSYLALIACPPLAAAALAWLVWGSRPVWGLAAIPLFALAWSAQGALAGEMAAAALTALACISLGWLLVVAVPGAWLRWGIYAMATLDAVLVAATILQGPSDILSAAAPGAELPRLQVIEFGAARMGFGDVFVAATVGCLLAVPADGLKTGLINPFSTHRRQLWGAGLVAAIGLGFDLLFFAVDTLPATVPVALALALVESGSRRRVAGRGP
jgi:hypothetical protein